MEFSKFFFLKGKITKNKQTLAVVKSPCQEAKIYIEFSKLWLGVQRKEYPPTMIDNNKITKYLLFVLL